MPRPISRPRRFRAPVWDRSMAGRPSAGRPRVVRYLASPPAGTPEHARDVGVRFPSGITRRQIVAGLGPKARTEIVLSGPFDGTSEASEGLGAVRDLTELALTSHLREKLG